MAKGAFSRSVGSRRSSAATREQTASFGFACCAQGPTQGFAQTPDPRHVNDSVNISGEVVNGPRSLKHHLRISYRQAPPQDLVIEAASETVCANMLVVYGPEVGALQRWTELGGRP
jgi:hypothetical protein